MKLKRIVFITLLLLFVVQVPSAFCQHLARTITVGWDYYPTYGSEDVVKFKLYWGTAARPTTSVKPTDPHSYTQTKEVLGIEAVQEFFTFAPPNMVYCTLTALDAAGNESNFSNEVNTYVSPWPSGRPSVIPQ